MATVIPGDLARLGRRVRVWAESPESYRLLDRHLLGSSWFQGGCPALAAALVAWSERRLRLGAVLDGSGNRQHFLAVTDQYVLDGDGAATRRGVLSRWRLREGIVGPRLEDNAPMPPQDGPNVVCPAELVSELVVEFGSVLGPVSMYPSLMRIERMSNPPKSKRDTLKLAVSVLYIDRSSECGYGQIPWDSVSGLADAEKLVSSPPEDLARLITPKRAIAVMDQYGFPHAIGFFGSKWDGSWSWAGRSGEVHGEVDGGLKRVELPSKTQYRVYGAALNFCGLGVNWSNMWDRMRPAWMMLQIALDIGVDPRRIVLGVMPALSTYAESAINVAGEAASDAAVSAARSVLATVHSWASGKDPSLDTVSLSRGSQVLTAEGGPLSQFMSVLYSFLVMVRGDVSGRVSHDAMGVLTHNLERGGVADVDTAAAKRGVRLIDMDLALAVKLMELHDD